MVSRADKNYYTLKDMDLMRKDVLVRVDFNVPVKDNKVVNDKRIKESLKTLGYILKKRARLILVSHLGRPKGRFDKKYTLKPVAKRLEKLLGEKVLFIDDCLKDIPQNTTERVILLENLRFYEEEKDNDTDFAKKLAGKADVFVNDAFGTSHRAHASVHGVTRYLPSCAGFLLEQEIKNLTIKTPKRPFVVILGGAKVSDKINVIKNLSKKSDAMIIGGAMIFTFFKAMGKETGKSLVEDDKLELAGKLLKSSREKLMLPVDVVAAKKPEQDSESKTYSVDEIPKSMMGLDIGEESIKIFSSVLEKAKTVVWNGPMGMFEIKRFAKGTREIAKSLAESRARTIIGGGDSATAIEQLKLEHKMTHVSTGGGASLEFLEGKKLPAIRALENNHRRYSKDKR